MNSSVKRILLLVYLSITVVQSAKILVIIPLPAASQFIFFQNYLQTLALRGHALTVVSHYPLTENYTNYRHIQLEYPNYHQDFTKNLAHKSKISRNFQLDFVRNLTVFTLENVEVQELLKSKTAHYDLVIMQTILTEALYAFGPHFKAPLIGASSFGTDLVIDKLVGNTSPLAYIPLLSSTLPHHMNFWQRLQNLELAFSEWWHFVRPHMVTQRELYKKYFPQLNMTLEQVMKNFSLLLVNQHFSLSFPRPYVPAMVQVGGMHINHKSKTLPKNIADFIDSAQEGVVYFSLGSNVRSKDLPAEKLESLLKVLGSLKQRVLWKFENLELKGKPENVFISKWFPQADILAHPKVKLFITHGGLLSTIEAIHHSKPIVGLPIFFDQFANMARAQLAGFGVTVDFHNFNELVFKKAILEALDNMSYTKAVCDISARYHDRPLKPLDEAIYWTEYIVRHKGANYMRVTAQDLSFFQYHSLDTLSYMFAKWIILPFAVIFVASRFIIYRFRNLMSKCLKIE